MGDCEGLLVQAEEHPVQSLLQPPCLACVYSRQPVRLGRVSSGTVVEDDVSEKNREMEAGRQIMRGFVGRCKDFRFY